MTVKPSPPFLVIRSQNYRWTPAGESSEVTYVDDADWVAATDALVVDLEEELFDVRFAGHGSDPSEDRLGPPDDSGERRAFMVMVDPDPSGADVAKLPALLETWSERHGLVAALWSVKADTAQLFGWAGDSQTAS